METWTGDGFMAELSLRKPWTATIRYCIKTTLTYRYQPLQHYDSFGHPLSACPTYYNSIAQSPHAAYVRQQIGLLQLTASASRRPRVVITHRSRIMETSGCR